MPDVVIIGAGIIGSSLAFRLTQAGAAVTIVDRNQPATGTTASTFAYINAATKRPRSYFELNFAGMAEHALLREEIGDSSWHITGGRLLWHEDPAIAGGISELVTESAGWGYRVDWLTPADVAEIEPDLRLPGGIERIAHVPQETAVDAALLAKRLLALAIDRGARTRFGQPVISFIRRGGRIAGVTLADGVQLLAAPVINCAGPEADHIAQLAGRYLPLDPIVGLIVHAELFGGAITRVLESSGILIRPLAVGGQELLLQQVAADSEIERGEPADEVAERLLEIARSTFLESATLALKKWTVAVRPMPADGVSSAGLLSSIPGYGEIVTHSGVTLGPLLARFVANEIAGAGPDPLLAMFRPGRFV
ncbi:MAG: NAD(P)/FAD-dependent oxidoreductase [Thermomicrobiales bacterium]